MNKLRKWDKYINRQYACECQIISAINARYFYFGKTIKKGSKRYENLIDEFDCWKEGTGSIWKLYHRFGLKLKRVRKFPVELIGKKPIEVGVLIPHKNPKDGQEYHSSLIIDINKSKDKIRVTNYRLEENGWQDLKRFLRSVPKKIPGGSKFAFNYYWIVEKK